MNINRCILIGRLTADPECRFTTNEIPVCRFTIAITRRKKEEADFIAIVAWRGLAKICAEYLKKGKQVAIEGRLQVRSYEKDGQKRYMTEIIADSMQMLGKKSDNTPDPDESEKGDDFDDV